MRDVDSNSIHDLQALKAQLRVKEQEIARLKLLVAKLQHRQFGHSAESQDSLIAQLDLRLGDVVAPVMEKLVATQESAPAKREHAVRKPLPALLPRDVQMHVLSSCDCPQCGSALQRIGKDVAEQLEYIPARFKVIRHVRPKFACRRCSVVLQAPAPGRPVARSMACAICWRTCWP